MMHMLTDTLRASLGAAAQHSHGLATVPDHLPPAPRSAVAKRLLGASLLEPADASIRTASLGFEPAPCPRLSRPSLAIIRMSAS